MTKHPQGVIVDQSALKFFNRIIKKRKEGRCMSPNTVKNQPWISQLFDDSNKSKIFGIIARGRYKIDKEVVTPNHRTSGLRSLKGNQPMPKIIIFTFRSEEDNEQSLTLEIAFKTEGKYLIFDYMQ